MTVQVLESPVTSMQLDKDRHLAILTEFPMMPTQLGKGQASYHLNIFDDTCGTLVG